MGAWGTAIFSDDLACDVRDEFRELVGEGLSVEEATKKLVNENSHSINDPGECCSFWLGLAAAQFKMGRLQEAVKEKALAIINTGADLRRWEDAKEPTAYRSRSQVLQKLKTELEGPPRSPTKIRKVFHDRTDWQVGHAVSYRLLSGGFVILRVIGIIDEGKSRIAIVELCDWIGDSIPDLREIARLPTRNTKYLLEAKASGKTLSWPEKTDHKFTVYSLAKRDFPHDRVAVVATGLKLKPTDAMGATYFGGWRRLDSFLRKYFCIE